MWQLGVPRGLWSVQLVHFAEDLLRDGQDGLVLPNLLQHHPAVEIIDHFLKEVTEYFEVVTGESAICTVLSFNEAENFTF